MFIESQVVRIGRVGFDSFSNKPYLWLMLAIKVIGKHEAANQGMIIGIFPASGLKQFDCLGNLKAVQGLPCLLGIRPCPDRYQSD